MTEGNKEIEFSDKRVNIEMLLRSYNDLQLIDILMNKNSDRNITDDNGNSPLIRAAMRGLGTEAAVLIDSGADVNIQNNNGKSALMAARENGHTEITELLKNSGAAEIPSSENLIISAGAGDYPAVEYLLESGIDVNSRDKANRTAYTAAVSNGHYKTSTLLKENGGAGNFSDETILNFVKTNNTGAVSILLRHGFDLNIRDRYNNTLLDTAVYEGLPEMAKLLQENGIQGDIDQSDFLSNIRNGNIDRVRTYLALGFGINKMYRNKYTPLAEACRYGNVELAGYLIDNGADITVKHYNDSPLLWKAVSDEQIELTELLIQAGADVNERINNGKYPADSGETALIRAVIEKNSSILKILIDAGAEVNLTFENNHSRRGNTPLKLAEYYENRSITGLLKTAGALE